jgi:hypothetical protein
VPERVANPAAGLQGEFETGHLKPGLYTLRATNQTGVQAPVIAELEFERVNCNPLPLRPIPNNVLHHALLHISAMMKES